MPDSPLVSVKSASSSISSPGPRAKVLGTIITKASLAARSPLPEAAARDALIAVFDEALAAVPTEALDAVYRRAIQAHTGAFPLGTGQLLAAWQAIRAEQAPPPQYFDRAHLHTVRRRS